jgi:putative phosphoesterase
MSDTHGNYPLALKACDDLDSYDVIIHLGDGGDDVAILKNALETQIINVAGNCDLGSIAPRELLWECEGKKLLLVHGDAYGVKSGLARLEKRAIETGVAAVLFGHTHHATVTNLSGILAVNPGTLMRSCQHTTYATLEITTSSIAAKLHDIH